MIEKYRVTYADDPEREWLAYPLSDGTFIVSPPSGETLETVKRFCEDLSQRLQTL